MNDIEEKGCVLVTMGDPVGSVYDLCEPEQFAVWSVIEKSLLKGLEENAQNAAFRDPRFPPLTKKELPSIEVEVSVLTVPQELTFADADDLKAKLKPGIHGVIVSRGWQRSTFLPQVWDQLPDPDTFLGHLCEKAGMARDCWKDTETVVQVYEAEFFSA